MGVRIIRAAPLDVIGGIAAWWLNLLPPPLLFLSRMESSVGTCRWCCDLWWGRDRCSSIRWCMGVFMSGLSSCNRRTTSEWVLYFVLVLDLIMAWLLNRAIVESTTGPSSRDTPSTGVSWRVRPYIFGNDASTYDYRYLIAAMCDGKIFRLDAKICEAFFDCIFQALQNWFESKF